MRAAADPEREKRFLLSRMEMESLEERDLRCPACGFRIQTLYSRPSACEMSEV